MAGTGKEMLTFSEVIEVVAFIVVGLSITVLIVAPLVALTIKYLGWIYDKILGD